MLDYAKVNPKPEDIEDWEYIVLTRDGSPDWHVYCCDPEFGDRYVASFNDQNEAVGIATLLNKGTKYDAKSKALDQAIELAAIHKDSFKIVSEEWARTVDSVPELATELEGRK